MKKEIRKNEKKIYKIGKIFIEILIYSKLNKKKKEEKKSNASQKMSIPKKIKTVNKI